MSTTTHPLALQREAERLRKLARLAMAENDPRQEQRWRRMALEMERRAGQ